MQRKVFKTGNSLVVSLPKEALEYLGLTEGGEVSIELDKEQQQIVISPAHESLPGVNQEFARQVLEFIDEYRPALEALAKK